MAVGQSTPGNREIPHFLLWGLIVAAVATAIWPRDAFASSSKRVVVSLGDSYSSGEGCPPFYGQDSADKYSEEDWLAHRSKNSWEGQLVLGDGTRLKDVKASQLTQGETVDDSSRWYFYASSGAVAVNVYSQEGNPDSGGPYYQSKDVESGIVEHGTPYHIAPFDWDEYKSKVHHDLEIQIDAALRDLKKDHLDGSDVDYVTMSIGGNDVGFVPIVTEVALRRGFVDRDYLFNALNTAWDKYDHTVVYQDTRENTIPSTIDTSNGGRTKKDEIKQCYKRIASEFPNAQILIVGYPTLLDDDAFEKTLARSEKAGLWNRFLAWAGFYKDNVDNMVGFASWESWFVNQNVRLFNSELSMLVSETNTELMKESGSAGAARLYFVSVEDAFDGHEAYTKEPYLNRIMPTQSEDLAFIPPVSSYSIHPNRLSETEPGTVSDGISAYREAVQRKIDELEDERPPVANEAPADLLKKYQDSLDIKNYTVDYLWQMMTYPITTYRWVVGEGIPDGAVLGSELRDFDGDKEDELLVVRWTKGSYAVEMVETSGGELVTVPLEADLRPQQVIDYPTDAYQMSSPILGAGCIDVCCDENGAVIVQSWYHTSPFSDGHEWLLDRFEYRGKDEGFVRVGRASTAGTGLGPMELQELIGQVKEIGVSTSALEGLSEQDAWQFNTLMLSDRDASIQLVARMEANSDAYGTDSYERQRQIYNETHEDWCDPQLLGTFETTSSSGKLTDKAGEAEDASSSASNARTILSATLDELKERAQVSNEFFDYSGLQYQFADLDDDGVDELFVSYLSGPWSETTSLIYKVQGDEAVRIFECVRRGCGFVRCYPQTQTVVFQMVYKAMVYTWHYQYEDGAMVQRACEFDGSNYNGTLSYETSEGHEVAEEEYRSAVEELAVGNAIDLTLESVW